MILLGLLLSQPAAAWVPSDTCSGGRPVTWAAQTSTYRLRDKYSGSRNFYGQLDDQAVLNAIAGGWSVWSNPGSCSTAWTQPTYQGTTTTSALANSSENVVEFFETGWDPFYGGVNSTIAVTLNAGAGCNWTEGDQIYNGVGFRFTTNNNPTWQQTDLQSIAAHENGHWLGLDHTGVQQATMFASHSGGIGPRSLHSDDEAGVCSLYPGSGLVENCSNGTDDDGDGAADCDDSDCSSNAACVCATQAILPCNSPINGTNSGSPADVDSYQCISGTNGWDLIGPEIAYTFSTPVGGTVTIDLTGLSQDLDLLVTPLNNGACDPNAQCAVDGQQNATPEQVSFTATANARYAVVVDGYNGATSNFTLEATCPGGVPTTESNCTNATDDDADGAIDCNDSDCASDSACQVGACGAVATLACGSSLTGNTAGGRNDVSTWSCAQWATTGPEAVYEIKPTNSGQVTVSLNNLTDDVDLFVTGDGGGRCDSSNCLAVSGESNTNPEQAQFYATAGNSYYIVIDGYQGATSAYTVSATCAAGATTETSCTNNVDDDNDGAVDCDDFDCNGNPACSGNCTNAGECGDNSNTQNWPTCEIWLYGAATDTHSLCSCFCQSNTDCPTGYSCDPIGGGDSACWPGSNICDGYVDPGPEETDTDLPIDGETDEPDGTKDGNDEKDDVSLDDGTTCACQSGSPMATWWLLPMSVLMMRRR